MICQIYYHFPPFERHGFCLVFFCAFSSKSCLNFQQKKKQTQLQAAVFWSGEDCSFISKCPWEMRNCTFKKNGLKVTSEKRINKRSIISDIQSNFKSMGYVHKRRLKFWLFLVSISGRLLWIVPSWYLQYSTSCHSLLTLYSFFPWRHFQTVPPFNRAVTHCLWTFLRF